MSQPRPGGTSWWCPVCLAIVEALVTPADTAEFLVDEARCPNPHGEAPSEIGCVTTERVVVPVADVERDMKERIL
jgi:hypothetical protein